VVSYVVAGVWDTTLAVLPQVQGGVCAPRTPSLSGRQQVFRTHPGKGTAHDQIGVQKGIAVTKTAHCDVLRRPFADPGQSAQAMQAAFNIGPRDEMESPLDDRARQPEDGVCARGQDPKLNQLLRLQVGDALSAGE